jgi:hypothetical protein
MTIYITPTTKIRDVEQRFSAAFPYLRIEFFSGSAVSTDGTITSIRAGKDVRIMQFAAATIRQIIITRRSTAVEIEDFFFHNFALYTKIFRKSAVSWTDVSTDDHDILQKLNWTGREESGALFDFELL